jgi:hypothetical protein
VLDHLSQVCPLEADGETAAQVRQVQAQPWALATMAKQARPHSAASD